MAEIRNRERLERLEDVMVATSGQVKKHQITQHMNRLKGGKAVPATREMLESVGIKLEI